MNCLANIEEVIKLEGPHTVAAVLVEPITGSNGIIVPPDGWLSGLRRLCDQYNILLIADEVMSGFGRTGRWFAVDHESVVPDIMTVAKGITSGYVPLGACIVSERVANHFESNPLWVGLTYNSHPVGCAAGVATLKIYQSDGLIENAASLGSVLLRELGRMKQKHIAVGDVRGRGLFSAMELVRDRHTREPLIPFPGPPSPIAAAMQRYMLNNGVSVLMRGSFLFANPPLCITQEQLNEGLAVLDGALSIADAAVA
jgi:taurine--2-oxoglutarate transaminase